jgi:hypothetical protein
MIKKRLKRSTDRGDAVVQAFWVDPGTAFEPTDDRAAVTLKPRPYRASKQFAAPGRLR